MKNLLYLLVAFGILLSCDKEEQITDIVQFPRIKIQDVTIPEDAENASVSVVLTWTYPQPVTVKYEVKELEDSSAEQEVDFAYSTGELLFEPGDTIKEISIQLVNDIVSESDERLMVELSEPVYAELLNTIAIVTITNDDTELVVDGSGYDAPDSYDGLTRVWEDEFSGTSIDASNWTHEIGGGGWGNNELQFYTDRQDNSFVGGGYLFIEAKEETFGERDYTSARMITMDKQEFQYGRIDIRAKLPEGKGLWPALWMLGADFQEVGWPVCGEIDIMELIGSQPKISHGTVHYGNNASDRSFNSKSTFLSGGAKFSDEFHVFSLIWRENYIEWLVDGKTFHQVTPADLGNYEWPFNDEFFFIFNVAVGGNWPGSPNDSTVFPQRMLVDYVRVYQ